MKKILDTSTYIKVVGIFTTNCFFNNSNTNEDIAGVPSLCERWKGMSVVCVCSVSVVCVCSPLQIS